MSFVVVSRPSLIGIGNPPKKKSIMSDSEVITIMILFHTGGFRDMKHFYLFYVKQHLQNEFPNTVSYNRFTELMQSAVLPMTIFLKTCCLGKCTGISYIDSTPNEKQIEHLTRLLKLFQEITREETTFTDNVSNSYSV